MIVLIQLLAAKSTTNVMLMCLNGNDAKVRTGSDYYHIPALVPNEGIHNVNTYVSYYLLAIMLVIFADKRDTSTLYVQGGPTKVKPTYIFVCKI